MKSSTRDRLILPVLIPVGALLVIVAVLYLFSRVLLTLTEHAATGVALVVASSVLIAGAVAFSRTHVRNSTLGAMVGSVAGIAMVSGGIAILAFRPVVPVAPFAASVVAGPGAATKGYQTTSLSVPASRPIDITFQNQDPNVPHNVAVTSDKAGSQILGAAAVVTGPATSKLTIGALQPGTFYFHCEVHPTTMTGTITVSAASSSTPSAPAGPTVIAKGLQFETKTFSLPANQSSTVTFENQDPGIQHNIDIFSDSSYTKSVFQGSLVTGPATQAYDVPSLSPGTYYFHCDVHPTTMTGTITVKAGAGGGGNKSSPNPSGSAGS